jgi:hypothetical protein
MTHEGRSIHDSQTNRTLHCEIRIKNTATTTGASCLPHSRSTRNVVDRVGRVSCVLLNLFVCHSRFERTELIYDPVIPRWGGHECSHRLDAFPHRENIKFGTVEVGVDDRSLEGVC